MGKIPCIRCKIILDSPDSRNARYIINHDDIRTHGPTEFDVFDIYDGEEKKGSFNKLPDAANDLDVKRGVVDKDIEKEQKEVDKHIEELAELNAVEYDEENPEPEEIKNKKNEKIALIMNGSNKVRCLFDKRQKIHMKARVETKIVPKTGIICLKEECQNENDTIIW